MGDGDESGDGRMSQVRANKAQGKAASSMLRQATAVSRADRLVESMVDGAFKVHNGRSWVLVRPTLRMVSLGIRFGDRVKTRTVGSMNKKTTKGR